EMRRRLHFLSELGLDYLSFNRSAATLSGGEGQRIRLAAQVGSGLQGVTYVLDEPSIGLHQQDQANLIKALMALRDKGNSILVVEHDPLMMAAADHLIELGPAAGTEGGMIVASGSAKQFWKSDALTARYLRGELKVPRPEKRRKAGPKWIQLLGASEHNLKQVNLKIPIGVLTVITGVSGS
ncbi:MAG: hypothetical protein VX278_18745, partial [Myxococcota bacterium]|nr:hypothetical protein [Myxococcota bacterium]